MEALPDNFTDRPEGFLGESGSNYLQAPPKKKLQSSWVEKPAEESSAATNGDDEAPQRRNSGSMVMQKLSELNKQNETCQAENSASKVRRHSEYPTTTKKSDAESQTSEKTESTQATADSHKSPALANQEKVSLQRKDIAFLAERPGTWLGGEGEEAEVNSYLQSPKTKLKESWLKKGNDGAQSLRDLTTLPMTENSDKLHASESSLGKEKAKRRQTSPMVMQQLSALNQKNEENTEKNKGLAVQKSPYVKSTKPPRPTPSKKETNAADVTPTKSSKDKVKFQKDEDLHMVERPSTWMGGEGEEAEHSYLQTPKTKLKDSWLKGGSGGTGMSQSMRDVTSGGTGVDSMSASDTHFSARRRQTSPMVMDKLLGFKKQNEENQQKNEELDPWVSNVGKSTPTKVWKPPKKAEEATVKEEESSPKSNSKDKVKFQKDEDLHMVERPSTWMGGEGEAVEYSYLQKPKTKLKDSWLKGGSGSGMSQSMRDVTSNEMGTDPMSASDTHFSARRRQTSPMVMEKLLGFKKQNEENHQRNEDLDPWVSSIGKSPPTKVWKPPKKAEDTTAKEEEESSPKPSSKDKVKFQKDEDLHMVERPTTWMGGEGEKVEYSYLQKPKTKLKDSWLKGGSGGGMSQSMRDVTTGGGSGMDSMSASDTHFSARRRQTSPMVMEKLLGFKKQNEENHQRNEELDPGVAKIEATKVWQPIKKETPEEEQAGGESPDESFKQLGNQQAIQLQRDDVAHLVARPDSWMGGEGEAAQLGSYLQSSPKAKLKDSWQKGDNGGGSDGGLQKLKISSLDDDSKEETNKSMDVKVDASTSETEPGEATTEPAASTPAETVDAEAATETEPDEEANQTETTDEPETVLGTEIVTESE